MTRADVEREQARKCPTCKQYKLRYCPDGWWRCDDCNKIREAKCSDCGHAKVWGKCVCMPQEQS